VPADISQSGPLPGHRAGFALLPSRLLSILTGGRGRHAKSSFPSLVASAGARSESFFCSFDRSSAGCKTDRFRKPHPRIRRRPPLAYRGEDFLVPSSTPSQTVTAGQNSGPYNLTIQPVGSLFSAGVTLSCSAGLPAAVQCMFSPPTPVTPGTSAVDVVMHISTSAKMADVQLRSRHASIFYALWLLMPGIVISWGGIGTRSKKCKVHGLASIVMLVFLTLSLLSCGGASSGGGTTPPGGGQTTIDQITVTGTSPGAVPDAGQSVQVTLVVN
jgi:hypothetical protein